MRLSTTVSDPEELLSQIVQGAMAKEGALIFTSRTGERHTLKSGAEELPLGLVPWMEARMTAALSYRTETQDSVDGDGLDPNVLCVGEQSWRLHLLYAEHDSGEQVVGGLALCSPVAEVPLDVQRAIVAQLEGMTQPLVAIQ